MRKPLRKFIQENRKEIDAYILEKCDNALSKGYRNDAERRSWIMNDEGLYSWARRERVNI